jgi:hypothetical protein
LPQSTVYVTVVSGALPTEPVTTVNKDAPEAPAVTEFPTSVPTYASACSGSVRYSSACSCVGAIKKETTAATPTTTIYVTECALPSPTAEACGSVLSGSDSRQYQVECGVSYSGESSISAVAVGSYNDCFKACEGNSACGSFSFDSGACSTNCKLFGFYDAITKDSSSTANSGFTPGTARDGTCGTGMCGAAVLGGTAYKDSYLVACRSSYSFDQKSAVRGSPFTATSFLDCLDQCDDIYECNFMSFDSSKFTENCAMFSKDRISIDVLNANPYVDSAKALVDVGGPPGIKLLADPSECPVYPDSNKCMNGPDKYPIHSSGYRYSGACGKVFGPKNPTSGPITISTLTVNTFAQCFDACDKNNHCYYMNFAKTATPAVNNCQFLKAEDRYIKSTPNADFDALFFPRG